MQWPCKAKKVTITPEWWESLFQEGMRPNVTVAMGLPAGQGLSVSPLTRIPG